MLRLQVRVLRDIFNNEAEETLGRQYLLNSVLFYCLLCVSSDSSDGESLSSELDYLIKKQSPQDNGELAEVLGALVDISAKVLHDPRQQQALDVVRSVLYSGWSKITRSVLDQDSSLRSGKISSRAQALLEELLPVSRQREVVDFCQRNSLSATAVHDWLIHKNRQSYLTILQSQQLVQSAGSPKKEKSLTMMGGAGLASPESGPSNRPQLDLHYLLGMQNLGYDVLKYYRLSENNFHKAPMSTKEQMVEGVSEIKTLLNSAYQYYSAQEDMHELLRNANPFYECFLNQIIASDS